MRRIPLFILLLAIALPFVSASTFDSGAELFFAKPVDSNLYAFGGIVDINAPVRGDVVSAAGNISVRSVVDGDVLAAGGQITLEQKVNGDVRVAGGTILAHGPVRGDAIAAGGMVRFDGPIGGDAALSGGTVYVGDVNGSLNVHASAVEIRGVVGGDARIEADEITFAEGARILGGLNYTSSVRVDESRVVGPVHYEQRAVRSPIDAIPDAFFGFVSSALIGMLLLLVLSAGTLRVASVASERPAIAGLVGLAATVCVPILCVMLLFTLVGIPLAIVLAAVLVIVLFIAKIFVALAVGMRIFENKFAALLAGLALYYLIGLVPIIGGMVAVAVALIGVGALVLACLPTTPQKRRSRRRP